MKNQLFRKETLERISSPEQLHDYMRVTNPSMWMVLSAIAALLVGFIIYASTATMESMIEVTVLVEDGYISSDVTQVQSEVIRPHMPVRLSGVEGEIGEIFLVTKLRLDLTDKDGAMPKDGSYVMTMKDKDELPEEYDGEIYLTVSNGIASLYDNEDILEEFFSEERKCTINGQKYTVESAGEYDATVISIYLNDDNASIGNGAYKAEIITESTKPISFLLN